MSDTLLRVVSARRGHFRFESGLHGTLWLDLDTLFVDLPAIDPLIDRLARALRPCAMTAVCGPMTGGAFLAQILASRLGVAFLHTERVAPGVAGGLYQVRYRLPASLRERAWGRRVAIVDDVISAGSAVRGTFEELRGHGAEPVAIGALLLLGAVAEPFFGQYGLQIDAASRLPFDLWQPAQCPLCAAGTPLEDPSASGASPSR